MQAKKIILLTTLGVALVAILWIGLISIFTDKLPNVLPPPKSKEYSFDYVIVGAGTAGSVIASVLAKHSNLSVLLLEAGGSFGFLSKIPLLATLQQKGFNDWSFLSVPQKYSSKGIYNQRQVLPRGKGIGGSSQLNFMLHYDGNDRDFNEWAKKYNLPEWSAKSFEPFREAAQPDPWNIYDIGKHYSKITECLDEVGGELAHKPWQFRFTRYNIRNGLRWSVYQQYLQPMLKNRNLKIMQNAMAKKVILKDNGKQIKSVIVGIKDDSGKETIFEVFVQRELILTAGAYQTPQLLLVSGIGNRSELEELNIPLQKHLPYVGYNLHDHMNLPLFATIDVVGPTLNMNAMLDITQIFSYLISGTGHLGNFGVLGHLDAINDTFGVTFFGAGAIEESALMTISNYKRDHFRALFPRYHNSSQEGFVMMSTCVQPKSRGTVKVKNSNIRKNPLIDPNYLSEKEDAECTIRAIRAAVEVATSSTFARLKSRILWPKLKECSQFGPFEKDFKHNHPSDQYLECILRDVGLSSHHPGGSCSMGTNSSNSVVDAQMRVHGIKGLRIADASILPTPISGNPNSVLIAMAIRGATMILKTEKDNNL